jgi:hypothetical protein
MISTRNNYKDVTVALILLLIIQVSLYIKLGVINGTLGGPDVYMWLVRALHLHENGNWLDHVLPRINSPEGYEQHWTRPFDMVLITGAWLGSIFTEFERSLYIWGVLVSPALEVLALFSFLWMINPILGNKENGVAGLLFVTQISIWASYVAGRADHQSLIMLFFILSIGIGLRMLVRPFSRKTCYLAAFLAALAIWVSVESIVFPLLTITAFGIFWLLGNPGFTRKLAHYSLTLFLLLVIFRIVEFGPSRLLEPTLDQLSIVYITLFGLIALFWTIINVAEQHSEEHKRLTIKLISAIVWAVGMAVLLEYCFPGFFSGPWGNMDELFRQAHHSQVKELQPLIPLSALSNGDWLDPLLTFSLYLGIIIPGIPTLIYLVSRSSGPMRWCWAFIGIHCLVYIPLSFNEVRWADYSVILMLPGYTWLIATLMKYVTDTYKGKGAGLIRVLILVGSAMIFILPEVIFGENEKIDKTPNCPLIPVSGYLSNPATWGNRPRNLLAFTDFGPELLYRTPHSIFSIPSHRYHSGFNDSYQIMSATDDAQALQLVKDRQIDLILICPDGHENNFYASEDGTEILHQRLSSNNAPAWMEQIKLPDDLAGSFKLYKVNLVQGGPRRHIEPSPANTGTKVQ